MLLEGGLKVGFAGFIIFSLDLISNLLLFLNYYYFTNILLSQPADVLM